MGYSFLSKIAKVALGLGALSLAACGGGGGGGAPTAPSEPLADLMVTDVTGLPSQWNARDSFTVSVTVRNQGGGSAGVFRVGLYASVDATITTDDELIGSSLTSDILEGGDSSVVTITVPPSSVPSGLVPQAVEDLDRGNYYLGAIADIQGQVDETDEENNDDHARNTPPPPVRFDPSPLTIGGALTGEITEGAASTSDTVTATDDDGAVDNAFKTDVSPTTGSYGTLTITTAGVWTYTLDNSTGGATDRLDGTEDPEETDAFTIMAADRTEATVTITITGVNDLSTLSGGFEGSVTEDSTTNATATGEITVADVDSTPLPTITAQTTTGTYGSFTLSKKTPSDEADRVYSWTYTLDNTDEDTNDLAAGTIVEDEFTITTSDSRVNTKVTITITGANDAATFSGTQTGAVTEDATVNTATGTITVSDVDGDNALKQQADQTGSYGSLSVNHSTGTWTYTLTNSGDNAQARATQALAGGETATETFTILAADDTPTTLTITITGVNDEAVFGTTGLTGAITEGTASTTGTVTSTDVDGDNNAFRTEVSPNDSTTLTTGTGTYGTLTITSAGAWTYTLDNSAGGATDLLAGGATAPDAFTIMAADGTSGTVTITITGVDDLSTLSGGFEGSVTEDNTTNATATGEITVADVDTTPIPTITAQTNEAGTYGSFTIGKKTPSDEADRVYSWTYTLDNADDDTNTLAAGTIVEDEFTITTSDGVNAKVTITITGADDSSTIGGALSGSVTEDDSDDLTAGGTATVTDRDSEATFVAQTGTDGSYGTFSITAAGVWSYSLDNSPGDNLGNATNALKAGQTESETFPITTSDGSSVSVTITVNGANDAAVFGTTGLTGSITEDAAPNTVTDTATSTDVDGEDNKFTAVTAPASVSGSYGSLTITEDGAWTYSLDNSNATVNALIQDATLTDSLTIQAKDGTAGTITITITGVNDKSSIDVTGSGGAVTEDDTANATVTGTFTLTDPDTSPLPMITEETRTGTYGRLAIAPKISGTNDGEYTWTYTLTNSGDNDQARATQALAGGATATETFTIAASDNGEAMVTITITGVNDAATFSGPATRSGAVTEDATSNTATGTITVTDVDGANALKEQANQTGSYGSLSVDHSAGTWTYTLTNSGDNARARATQALADEETATETFTILAADDTETMVTITITGVNDAAVFGTTGLTGSITEDAAPNTVTDTVTSTDVDGEDNKFTAVTAPASVSGTYGSLTITEDGAWTYSLDNSNATVNALGQGATLADSLTIQAKDGTAGTITITITGANDAATFSGPDTRSGAVTEDATSNTATGTITVTDVDGANALKEQANQTGSYGSLSVDHSAGTWTYTLTNSGDNARARATQALADEETATETFTILAADDTETMVTITITGVNDAAVFGTTGLTGSITEDAAPNTVTDTVTSTDVDGEDNKFTAVTAPASVSGTYGSLTITEDGAWTYSLDNSNATVNALGQGATLTDSLTIQTADGTAGTITITITGANDAATFSGTQSGAVTEDATVNTATGTITVSDVDGDNALKQQADQTGSYGNLSVNHSTGVWTYTLTNSGDNARARATQALAGGATATETFTILAADDTPTTLTITITGANDAATIGGAVTGAISEGTASTTGTVTSTDVDGTDNAFRTEVSPNDGTTLTTGRGTYGTLTITSAGAWTYTLDNSAGGATDLLAGGATAPDAFTIMAADGTSGTVTITITGVDDLSTLSGGFEGSVTEDSTTNATATGEITVADIDTTPLPTITAQTTTGTYGSFTIGKKTPSDEADRVYSWTYTLDNADDDTNALAAGTIVEDEFTITTSDGVNAKVTITITGADDSSTIGGALSGSVTEDDSDDLTAGGTATVTDRDSEATFVAQTGTDGSYGTFSITTAGVWSYSLDNSNATVNALGQDATLADSLTIQAKDGTAGTITITITGVNDKSSIDVTGSGGSVTEDDTANATVTGTFTLTDPDTSPLPTITEETMTGTYGRLAIAPKTSGTNNGEYTWTYTLDNEDGDTDALAAGSTETETFTIAASDNGEAMVTISITGANDPATFSGPATRSGAVTEDAAVDTATGTITVTDVDGDNALKQQADQTGSYGSLSVNHSTGTWTYTLTSSGDNARARATQALAGGETANETFTILAADDTETMVTITITGVNDAATIGGTMIGAITEGTASTTGTVTSTDVDGANTFKTEVSPTTGTYGSLTITNAGVWTYTLDNSAGGATDLLDGNEAPKETDAFVIMAADGTEATVTITITGFNDDATIGGAVTGAINEGTASTTGTVTSTDPDGTDNAFRTEVSPNDGTTLTTGTSDYGTLTITSAGVWTYTLDNSDGGATDRLAGGAEAIDTFTIMAADGTSGMVTITITGVNDAATIAGTGRGDITEDAAPNRTWGTMTATDADGIDNSFKTEVTPTTGSYGSLTITTTGAWTYTLNNTAGSATDQLAVGATVTDAFTIMAEDGTQATVTLTITGVNDPARFGGTRTGTVTEDMVKADSTPDNQATGTATATDVDGTDDSFKTEVMPATGRYGNLTITSAGVWTYTLDDSDPDTAALRNGQSVTDAFTILAEDGTPTTVTITVNGADDPSSIDGDLAGAVTENDTTNNTANGTVTINDVGTAITAKTETSAYGLFTLRADRTWTYSLDNSFPATNALAGGAMVTDPFTIAASDGSSATVIITITGADDPDLLVASVSGLPVQWKDGDSFTATASLRNQGKVDAGAFEVGLYASADRAIATGDTRIASASVSTLAKDASTSVSLMVSGGFATLGLTQGRTYYLGVIADIGNSVAEADEGNNDDHANSIPTAASLIASDSTAPSETILVDSSYNGRWGWRGPGVDGPRGVAVDPWGTAAPISNFETNESNRMGWWTRRTTSRDWNQRPNSGPDVISGDPIGAIGARDAYAMGLDGSGVIVAVADSHIDSRHVDLDGNFLRHYDASGTGVVASNKYGNHGTHVAGIIAAEADGKGMHGIAPGANLIGISFGSQSGGQITQDLLDLRTSITSAVEDGARVFNNSWGTEQFTEGSLSILTFRPLRKSFADAIDEGAVFIWSAGNSYSKNKILGDNNTSEEAKAPLYYPELAGGFVNVVNLAWDSSNSVWKIAHSVGPYPSWPNSQICGVTKNYCLGAPGTFITSTRVGNAYGVKSGTSMAAPMVSGGLAVLFQAFPYVETKHILRLLFETATDLGEEGVDSTYGHGMMNLKAALNPVGSRNIPTTGSTATNAGIDVQTTALLAEVPLRTAVASATADMVMLDDYDRAFVIGDVMNELAVSDIQPLSIASADAVFASVDAELASLRDFGSPITQAAAKAGALTIIGDRLTLPSQSGTSEVVLNSIATEDSGLAEFRYVATRAEEGWKASQSLGVIVEEDQLFGNKGSGAYALASQATTVSLGTSGQRDISEGVTLFGGLGLSRTEVSAADQSLVSLSSQFTSASGVVGLRMRDLGAEDRGEFAIQLGQDRAILSGEGSISVPVGREEGGVILFDEVQFDSAALGLEPELMMSYANEYAPDASYSLSAAGRGEETILSAQWQRAF